jgi:hypothetical protein
MQKLTSFVEETTLFRPGVRRADYFYKNLRPGLDKTAFNTIIPMICIGNMD